MSLKAIQAAMRKEGLSAGQKVVLIGLADRVGDRLTCWPRVELLAKDVGMSPRTVQRHMAALVELGVVTRVAAFSPRTGRQSSNVYRLELWELPDELRSEPITKERAEKTRGDRIDTPGDLRGDRIGNRGVTELDLRGDNSVTPLKENPKVNPKKNLSLSKGERDSSGFAMVEDEQPEAWVGAGFTRQFEAWWERYPKKTGKNAAFAVWRELMAEEFAGKAIRPLFDGLKTSPALQREERRYLPAPAKWLRDGGYWDEPEADAGDDEDKEALRAQLLEAMG